MSIEQQKVFTLPQYLSSYQYFESIFSFFLFCHVVPLPSRNGYYSAWHHDIIPTKWLELRAPSEKLFYNNENKKIR